MAVTISFGKVKGVEVRVMMMVQVEHDQPRLYTVFVDTARLQELHKLCKAYLLTEVLMSVGAEQVQGGSRQGQYDEPTVIDDEADQFEDDEFMLPTGDSPLLAQLSMSAGGWFDITLIIGGERETSTAMPLTKILAAAEGN